MKLKGKVVVITGTKRGIGKATKELLERKGCSVYSLNRDENMLIPFGVDVLINNAGVFFTSPIEETSIADWEKSFETNVTLPFKIIKFFLRHDVFNPDFAVILNVNSSDIIDHPTQQIAYNCSKAALHELTLSLMKELFKDKIIPTEIFLPTVKTDMLKNINPSNPLPKKILTPKEAARRIWDHLRKI